MSMRDPFFPWEAVRSQTPCPRPPFCRRQSVLFGIGSCAYSIARDIPMDLLEQKSCSAVASTIF